MNENIKLLTLPTNDYILKLEEELDFYQNEYNNLQREIKDLLKENKKLSNNIEDKFNSNFLAFSDHDICYKSEIINNLKSQISFITQEKLYAIHLYQITFKEVDNLEQQLHLLQKKNNCLKNEKIKNKNNIEEKNENYIQTHDKDLLKKYHESLIKIHSLENKVLISEEKLQVKEEKYKNVIDTYQTTLKELNAQNEELQRKIEIANLEISSVMLREAHYKEEIVSLKNAFSDIVKETNSKLLDEVNYIKEKNNEKFQKLMEKIKILKLEIDDKNNQISTVNKKVNNLESTLGKTSNLKRNKFEIIYLKKQLDETVEKLNLVEQQNSKLSIEYGKLRQDLIMMSRNYERNIYLMLTDSQKLKSKIQILESELEIIFNSLQNKIVEFEELSLQLTQFKIINKLENNQILEDLLSKFITLNKKNKYFEENLKKNLGAVLEINKRWEQEFNTITENVEKRMKFLKHQISTNTI